MVYFWVNKRSLFRAHPHIDILLKISRKPTSILSGHLLLVVSRGQRLTLFGSQRNREAQLLEPADGPALGRFGGLFVGMARSQFAVGLALFEQVIDDEEDAVCQGHDGFLAAQAFLESLVVGPQVGVLAACSSVGGFDERLAQPAIALARFGAQAFAGADLGFRTVG